MEKSYDTIDRKMYLLYQDSTTIVLGSSEGWIECIDLCDPQVVHEPVAVVPVLEPLNLDERYAAQLKVAELADAIRLTTERVYPSQFGVLMPDGRYHVLPKLGYSKGVKRWMKFE